LEPFDVTSWFEELYIHESAWDSPVANRVRSIVKVEAKRVYEKPFTDLESDSLSGNEFDHSKKRLYLAPHQGHFFRKCPGTTGAACCNYFVLNLGVQCNMNCSYCYLQSYINSPMTQVYTNISDALLELEQIALRNPSASLRIGTGETIDSLSLDDLTGYSDLLVEWFSKYPRLTCEFKTKSNNIKNFINTPHAGNVVVSFSINPQQIIESHEHRTANLKERLQAARSASDKGFPIAFHIDPMIYDEDWQNLYNQLVDQVATTFKPSELKWISVGALRFQPSMKHIMRERFGARSLGVRSELFLSQDGKLRYDQALRTKMFDQVISRFKIHDKSYPVFLCMETPETWLATFDSTPRQAPQVSDLFTPVALQKSF
jgi:spore photoproduct lyase